MFQSPGGLLLILSVRSHCTQESRLRNSCEIFVLVSSGSVAALPDCPSPFMSLWKLAFSAINAHVQAPSGRPDAYKRKNTAFLLCFLVAGRRIELRTSWLWIMRSNQLSYPAIILGRSPTLLRFCWDRRTRTLTDRARICSATITPYLNLASLFEFGTAKVWMFY